MHQSRLGSASRTSARRFFGAGTFRGSPTFDCLGDRIVRAVELKLLACATKWPPADKFMEG